MCHHKEKRYQIFSPNEINIILNKIMIEFIALTNFFSFKERTEFSLKATKEKPRGTFSGEDWWTEVDGVKLLKAAFLLGNNGSGKTNLGLAIFDIVMTLTDNPVDLKQMDIGSFLNGDGDKDHAVFEYEFQQNGRIIRYEYHKTDPTKIIFERLDVDGTMIFAVSTAPAITEDWQVFLPRISASI